MADSNEQSFRERIYRRNFFFFLVDNILFNIAMGIINSNTVIPDFVRRLTNSEILIGLSGNLFMVGFHLPTVIHSPLHPPPSPQKSGGSSDPISQFALSYCSLASSPSGWAEIDSVWFWSPFSFVTVSPPLGMGWLVCHGRT